MSIFFSDKMTDLSYCGIIEIFVEFLKLFCLSSYVFDLI